MSRTTDYIIGNDIKFDDQESGESHSPNQCNLCGKIVDERAMQEQCGLSLCISCDGKYSDEELLDERLNQQSLIETGLVSDYDKGGKS